MEVGYWVLESTNFILRYINGVYDKIPAVWDNGDFGVKFWEVPGTPVDQAWASTVKKETMLNDKYKAKLVYSIPIYDPQWRVVGTEDAEWSNWDGVCGPSMVKVSREAAGLTQKTLADKADVNIRLIQKLESGETLPQNLTLKNAIAIADALGVEPKDLI